jgi:hypothetical protein
MTFQGWDTLNLPALAGELSETKEALDWSENSMITLDNIQRNSLVWVG